VELSKQATAMSNSEAKPQMQRARAEWPVRALVGAWLLSILVVWCLVERYALAVNEPSHHRAVAQWPADSALQRVENRPSLVLFLHPKCPCSRASLKELERLLTATANANAPVPNLIVVATVPPSAPQSWWDTSTVAQSRALARAHIFIDRGGREAARFGATTSGMLMYFDKSGTRRYAGGITIARGHEGQSAGADALAALFRGETAEMNALPAFGCRLCLPQRETEVAGKNQSETFEAKS
jgi:hypothetical protein